MNRVDDPVVSIMENAATDRTTTPTNTYGPRITLAIGDDPSAALATPRAKDDTPTMIAVLANRSPRLSPPSQPSTIR